MRESSLPAIGWILKNGETISYDEAITRARTDGAFEKFPAPVLQAMRDERVDGNWLSPSAAGSCLRQQVLKQTYDYYQDLEGSWTSFTGNAYHREIAYAIRGTGNDYHEERWIKLDLDITLRDGRQTTVTLQGTPDLFDTQTMTLYDWKTIGDFVYYDTDLRQKVTRSLPYPEHELQINLYALIFRWQGLDIDRLFIWYVKSEGKKGVTRRLVHVPLWDLEDVYHTACELAEPIAWYRETGELPQEKYDPQWKPCKFCPLVDICVDLANEGK